MQGRLLILLMILLAVNVSAVPINTLSSDGRLHIIHVADNSLEAIFHNADAGIHIIVNSLSLSLYSMDGEELLLSGDKPHGSSLFATVLGHSFLEYNTTLEDGTQKMVDYIVPNYLAEQTKMAIETEKEKVERMLSQLDDNDTQAATDSAFQELFQRPEIALIESAALALGRAGVMGYENQGALNFYMVARALIKARGREEVAEGDKEGEDEGATYEDDIGLYKRAVAGSGDCERLPIGNTCIGMCGRGTTCWSWVCGDCCYHQGCYEHDTCCIARGFYSLPCLFPVGFTCSGYHCY